VNTPANAEGAPYGEVDPKRATVIADMQARYDDQAGVPPLDMGAGCLLITRGLIPRGVPTFCPQSAHSYRHLQ
jgi:hypothetical protein